VETLRSCFRRPRVFLAAPILVACVSLVVVIVLLNAYARGWLGSDLRVPDDPRYAVAADSVLNTGKNLYSQLGEELVIRDFFGDRQGGVFLDVGCADPVVGSTTCYLDKHLNWTGIAVDALERYRPAWESERPKTKFFAYAVTDRAGERMKFYEAPEPTVSSVSKERVEAWGLKPIEIDVETITLNKLLDDNGIARIDFLSMDIEGAEFIALKGFDIARFRPSLVCVEKHEGAEQDMKAYFAEHGYELIQKYRPYDHVNLYFTPAPPSPSSPN